MSRASLVMYLLDSRLWMQLSIRSPLPPPGSALIGGQAESRLLCFLSVSQDSEPRSEKGGGTWGQGKTAQRTPAYDARKSTAGRLEGENESLSSLRSSLHNSPSLQVGVCSVGESTPPPSSFLSCPPIIPTWLPIYCA